MKPMALFVPPANGFGKNETIAAEERQQQFGIICGMQFANNGAEKAEHDGSELMDQQQQRMTTANDDAVVDGSPEEDCGAADNEPADEDGLRLEEWRPNAAVSALRSRSFLSDQQLKVGWF